MATKKSDTNDSVRYLYSQVHVAKSVCSHEYNSQIPNVENERNRWMVRIVGYWMGLCT